MQTFIFVLIVAAAIATLYILVRGVMTMAQGKDITGERSQALMRKRVLFQGIAVVFIVLFLLLASGGRS